MRRPFHIVLCISILMSVGATPRARAKQSEVSARLAEALSDVPASYIPTGILYDRVLPLSHIDRHDGRTHETCSLSELRQMTYELRRASDNPSRFPDAQSLRPRTMQPGEIPIAITNIAYNRLAKDALKSGAAAITGDRLEVRRAGAVETRRAFAVAPLQGYTYRGNAVRFRLDPEYWVTDPGDEVTRVAIDPGDGLGFRTASAGEEVAVSYARTGIYEVRTRVTTRSSGVHLGAFQLDVRAQQTPAPDDTLSLTASIDHQGQYASGEAFVYLAAGHTEIVNPIMLVEGFDLDNTMNWDELYALLNDETLIETVRADGYDIVVLNFDDATISIMANGYLLVELLQQIDAMIPPQAGYTLVGASMGGLVSRYAVAYMETNALPHHVRTLITFDTPHKGANIPLGIQYWLDFFSDESTDAAFLLSRLDTPAARQMLVYHHTTPPSATPQPDAVRANLVSALASVGDYPAQPRLVAFANGSGSQADQGFAAGAQIIRWEYTSLLVDVTGNVWAVPNGGPTRILQAEINLIWPLPDESLDVTVSNSLPYDNCPGGSRNSMQQMDEVPAPYGDIVALYNSHCFVPVISALDHTSADLFYDLAGDPNVLAGTPFDAVYFPAINESHVDISPVSAAQALDEIRSTPSSAGGTPMAGNALGQNIPNPFNPSTVIPFTLDSRQHVRLSIYDVRGRLVATPVDEARGAGANTATWDGRNSHGRPVASGVYFYQLDTATGVHIRKMTLLK